jgi:hypothetical protein
MRANYVIFKSLLVASVWVSIHAISLPSSSLSRELPTFPSTCPPFSGTFVIDQYKLYPENADFDFRSCLLYIGYVYGSVLSNHEVPIAHLMHPDVAVSTMQPYASTILTKQRSPISCTSLAYLSTPNITSAALV